MESRNRKATDSTTTRLTRRAPSRPSGDCELLQKVRVASNGRPRAESRENGIVTCNTRASSSRFSRFHLRDGNAVPELPESIRRTNQRGHGLTVLHACRTSPVRAPWTSITSFMPSRVLGRPALSNQLR